MFERSLDSMTSAVCNTFAFDCNKGAMTVWCNVSLSISELKYISVIRSLSTYISLNTASSIPSNFVLSASIGMPPPLVNSYRLLFPCRRGFIQEGE